jgi:hypothetical protein
MLKIIIASFVGQILFTLLWNEFFFRHNVLKIRRLISKKFFKVKDIEFNIRDLDEEFWEK